jgi:hypothetical protein
MPNIHSASDVAIGAAEAAAPSPLPWRQSDGIVVADLPNGSTTLICDCNPDGMLHVREFEEANAALIVRAVNSYHVMVDALEFYAMHGRHQSFGDKARAALALAKG